MPSLNPNKKTLMVMKTVTLWPLGYGYPGIFRCSATGLEELWICGSRGLECRPFFAPSWEMCRIKMLKESWLFFAKFGMDKRMSIKKYFTGWTAMWSLLDLLENVLYSKVHLKSFGKCVDETARLPPMWPGSIPYSTLRSGWICWFPALPQEDFPLGIPIFPSYQNSTFYLQCTSRYLPDYDCPPCSWWLFTLFFLFFFFF